MTDRTRPLHLPFPAGPPGSHPPRRISSQRRRRRSRSARWRQAGAGLLLGFSGAGVLLLLMQLPERLDTILLVSNAVSNLIRGLAQVGMGVMQLAAVLGLVVLALFALLLLVAGGVRMIRAMAPRPGKPPGPRPNPLRGP
jgi:hypothetical protein